MKGLLFLFLLLLLSIPNWAQDKANRPSPAVQTSANINGKTISINYGQPSVKGRKIWGELVPYGQVWRAGANETTAFTIAAEAQIEGKTLPAGKYALFMIPNEKEWTVIFNQTIKWGAFSYKQEEDVLRIAVSPKKSKAFAEKLMYEISNNGQVSLTWENTTIAFKVQFISAKASPSSSTLGTFTSEIKVPMNPENWTFKAEKVEFVDYKGVKAMKMLPQSGPVSARSIDFKDGTIEFDLEPLAGFFHSIYFHRQSEKEQEIFYLRARLNDPNANDAVQYAPYFDGVNMWDMYPNYQGPALIKDKAWNHIKLVISGLRLRVFVNDMSYPVLDIPKLEGRTQNGTIAFEGEAMIANLVLKHNQTEGLSAAEAPDLTAHDAHYLRKWLVSPPVSLPIGSELHLRNLPKDSIFTAKIDAERQGLVNLTRKFGASKERRVIWLKAKINAKTAQRNALQLGFSDEVWVFLNRQMAYVDKNLYRDTNVRKTPDGRISILNATLPLQFKEGENELLIGIANDFYGWGIIARLESLEGLELVK